MAKLTFGIIIGNGGFFPDSLVKQGRKELLEVLKKGGYNTIALSLKESKFGAVETYADAKKCADLFADHADKIDGIIVSLPNFGDEKGVVEVVKRSGLSLPIRCNSCNKPLFRGNCLGSCIEQHETAGSVCVLNLPLFKTGLAEKRCLLVPGHPINWNVL